MEISFSKNKISKLALQLEKKATIFIFCFLSSISIIFFYAYYINGLGLAYNDARSHLDIGRRVVEGLKPGLAQLGSVWLPLNHALMIPTIWNNWMWHSGLAGAVQSMISFVITGVVVYKFLEKLNVGLLARVFGVLVFILNLNVLYLQSTAMTELLLLSTMTAGCYYLVLWAKNDDLLSLIKSALFIMLSTLVRYDGWFLLFVTTAIVAFNVFRKKGYKQMEGKVILFVTLGVFGVALWFLWNLLIFNDPLYFALGPFSAHAQQSQLSEAGDLPTKFNLLLSLKIYVYALLYNSYTIPAILGVSGMVLFLLDKKIKREIRIASLSLIAPFGFNVLALFLGFSVLFVQGISGNSLFNVRYGVMLAPSIAIFIGYLVDKVKSLRIPLIGLASFIIFFAFVNQDAVTIDDARVGSSQKNVSEVSGWLSQNTSDKDGFVLISAASHDAIIFSSGLPMKKFIHEGTGLYWESATTAPDKWARWIVLRTYDDNDLTFRLIKDAPGFKRFELVDSYPFADIYQLKEEYLGNLNTKPVFSNQK
ncbi:hypothetical protein A2715_04525 [Candidatus Woesebacteria bacterium RIFCSPHIGHO2_01_FULL_39_32]|uniref:Glycosyl transferase family 2 n=2 Tax=Candidatus Woeseibacteriota TaxID=1752722 RepID=A0A0G0PZD7_9BACT|nr:MAG: Glycosyl transferase family 2 [Candidatus Woesebacteria bacterium GW2011_GWA1_39_8]OGM04886.1 MAG: hypothetical protein A2124_02580 [Candidatus Woesebacteria bacterium GWB1_37_5]OGM25282.1 MAG: hypothetical protein A2715_04525 [Candidatus Woesebacteria bacterium RIFCSPHIGHO2_01_FULL_39_32]OGM37781.1 MAG: hypothetical protein A3F01_01735 [Candidatus Woesebacteria bacterium RIFCSPHIGHO2_12_FULL_38_11]OGM64813.1 MAG: hypothetical protein A2893_04135 [Candidatus Woesebacteria bacterium RIFC